MTQILFIAAILIVLAPTITPAQTEAEATLNFAQSLLAEGDYFRAAGEAERFLFLYPDHARIREARDVLNRAQGALEEVPRKRASQGLAPWNPETGPDGPESSVFSPAPSANQELMIGLVRFYQDHLRTFRNPALTCPSYPCNSDYALEVLQKHGVFWGASMTVDRFWREATHAGQPPFVLGYRGYLHYDPPEHNDYWLNLDPEEP